MVSKTQWLLYSFLLIACGAEAQTADMYQTKSKLKQLETKISDLQRTLNSAHDKNGILNQKLSSTEKKISIGVQQLRTTQQNRENKQHKIALLQQQVNALNEQLHTQQHTLAKHIRTRYTMGEYQPLKWLLNQDNPYTTSRLLTFYQYIIQSQQHTIDTIQVTRKNIALSQANLQQEIDEQQQLQQQLNKNQQLLEQDKLDSTAIIHSLNQDIQSTQQTLNDYQQNKENLSRLLTTLMQQSLIQTQHPLVYQQKMMFQQKKLPRPVGVKGNNLQKLNQGIVFFANEGTPVTAVSPGKIVFSDWLKGYGLLIIIDHGQGFMTLYAHNQSLFKQKGETVYQGEQIASVGHSGGLKKNGLYFEIRQRGKPVSPLKWLS